MCTSWTWSVDQGAGHHSKGGTIRPKWRSSEGGDSVYGELHCKHDEDHPHEPLDGDEATLLQYPVERRGSEQDQGRADPGEKDCCHPDDDLAALGLCDDHDGCHGRW